MRQERGSRHFRFIVIFAGLAVLLGGISTAVGQVEVAKLTASDAAERDELGTAVAIDGDYIIVGAHSVFSVDGIGKAYIFRRNGGWVEEVQLPATGLDHLDFFGNAVGISGNVAVVGLHGDDDVGDNMGSVYVYRRTGAIWSMEQKLTASDAGVGDLFGGSVAIDGDYIAVGAPKHDLPLGNSGAVYIFHHNGTSWDEQAKLSISDGLGGDYLGRSDSGKEGVSISGDRVVAIATGQRSAYVFRRDGANWVEEGKLSPPGLTPDDLLSSTSIRGHVAAVGVYTLSPPPGDADLSRDMLRDPIEVEDSSSVYLYRLSSDGWTDEARIVPEDDPPSQYVQFGYSVSLGDCLLVAGAPEDSEAAGLAGAMYLFTFGDGSWTQQAKFTASDATSSDYLGFSVAISGQHIIGGAPFAGEVCPNAPSCNFGAAYVYRLAATPDCPDIPAMSSWGALILALLLLVVGTQVLRRRQHALRLASA